MYTILNHNILWVTAMYFTTEILAPRFSKLLISGLNFGGLFAID